MILLAIENSAPLASICLYKDTFLTHSVTLNRNVNIAEALIPTLEALLEEAKIEKSQIEGVVFSQGPGSFTGCRVSAGIAQGIAQGLNIPIYGVNIFESTVSHIRDVEDKLVFLAFDARMDEVYLGGFYYSKNRVLHEVIDPLLVHKDDVIPYLEAIYDGLYLKYGHTVKSFNEKQSINKKIEKTDKQSNLDIKNCYQEQPFIFAGNVKKFFPHHKYLSYRPRAFFIAHFVDEMYNSVGRYFPRNKMGIDRADGESSSVPLPFYLRKKVAFTSLERKSGFGGNPKSSPPEIPEDLIDYIDLAKKFRNEGLNVELMDLEDVDRVYQFDRKVHATPWSRDSFSYAYYDNNYINLMLLKNGELIGTAVQLLYETESHLMTIGILEEYRNKGYAKLLIELMHLIARDKKIQNNLDDYQQILEVRVSNHSAINLYEKFGYENIGVRKGYYDMPSGKKEDGLVYAKKI